MSGIEVVGVVLAVLPLCITALERCEDETRPFKALFKYEAQLAESKMELFFAHASFAKTIQNLCEDASVAQSDQFDEILKDPIKNAWLGDESERKLVQFLSRPGYDAYRFKASTICDQLMEVASILGLDEKGLLKTEGLGGFRTDLWKGVTLAKEKTQSITATSRFPSMTQNTFLHMRKRVRFILKSGNLGPLVQKISKSTQELDRLIEKSSRPHALPVRPTQRKSKDLFARPLLEIEEQARRLHQTLHEVWQCPDHPTHCVNLRLESRLRKQDNVDADQNSFTIALSPSAQWRLLGVRIMDPTLKRPTQAVNFQLPNIPSDSVISTQSIIRCLCQHTRTTTDEASLCLNSDGKLSASSALCTAVAATPASPASHSTTTLKEVLAASRRPGISAKQSMRLALTLISSFLQLQSTPWLENRWCAEDVILICANAKLDIDWPFIMQVYPAAIRTTGKRMSDSDRVFALGTILLQIVTQTPIEEQRTAADATLEDPSIMRSCLHDDAEDWLDCFAEAIAACSMFYHGRFDMDLNDTATRNEFIEAVLVPFQRDLKW